MSRPDDFDPLSDLARLLRGPDATDASAADDEDAPLDPVLLAAARAAHEPPPTPADAMWAAIQARRAEAPRETPSADGALPDAVRASGPALRVVAGRAAPARRGASVRDGSVRSAWARGARAGRRWAPLAAAAAVLLATGIGIGRYSAAHPGGPVTPAVAAAPGTAAPGTAAPGTAGPMAPTHQVAGTEPAGPNGAAESAAGGATSPAERPAPVRDARTTPERPRVAARTVGAPVTVAALPDAPGSTGRRASRDPAAPDSVSTPLRAVAERHLADAEALLTTFAALDGGADRSTAAAAPDSAWARDLLTTTRLLLDSPAGRDPARRTLLESLELVLVQIARLPHTDTPAERALIDRAIRSGDLLARLRSAVPSGPARRRDGRGA